MSITLKTLFLSLTLFVFVPQFGYAQKQALLDSIQTRDAEFWEMALKIWEWSEPGYQEFKSSALLAKRLQNFGFDVKRGVVGIPTAFTATFPPGGPKVAGPVIGILGEYDALPGLSQQTVPYRQPRDNVTYGHACGHHLFGVASASAAIAVAEQIKAGTIQGTVRYYGCPAEEGGSGKVFMVRDGLFKDCDAVLHRHPGNQNSAGDRSTLARMAVKFRFRGKAAHAAGAPDQGRSALDAVELTNFAAQLLREHTPDLTRIHHVITAGGDAPNIVPEFAEVYYYIRHPQTDVVAELYKRLVLCAKAGALATATKLEVNFQGGIVEILPNNTLSGVAMKNLRTLNDLKYSAEEMQFALRVQETIAKPLPLDDIKHVHDRSGTIGMGSTDVGDVSWVVPSTGFGTACWVPGTPGHSWQAVAAGGTSIARKGMHLAAQTLAATAWDLYQNPDILDAAAEEHARRLGNKKYRSLMQPGQKPPLDYRKPPRKR